jgi:hypothetical protein
MGASKCQAIATVVAWVFVLLLVSACGNGDFSRGSLPAKQVKGHVSEVIGRNIIEVETLRIKDSTGKDWTFTTEGFVGFTPSHIRQHQLFGESVVVSYVEKGGKLVAVEIAD